jgi:hypothetical protein
MRFRAWSAAGPSAAKPPLTEPTARRGHGRQGRYTISGAATNVALGTNLYAGTPGTTLYLPSTSSQPAVTTPATLVTVKSGTGVMPPGTT